MAPLVWDDPRVDWSQVALVLVRTTWDYTERLSEYLAWVDLVDAVTVLRNPASVIRWNSHKSYLRDLAARGVPTVPTVWLGAGGDDIAAIAVSGWDRVVVKPSVSAGARDTWLTTTHALLGDERERLEWFVAARDVMVQPYLAQVERRGEVSLLAVRGQVTHAVRKLPAPGDFRVQDEFGGTHAAVAPTATERAVAAAALAATPEPTLYARIDLLPGDDGEPRLVELEVIEPALFLGYSVAGTAALADAVATEVATRSIRGRRRRG